jgi:hypothetical protein
MKTVMLALFLLVPSAVTAPLWATQLDPVAAEDLDQFQGQPIRGFANVDLGTVSRVDMRTGTIGIAGKYGEFALLSTSMLGRNGKTLHAPTVSVGDLKFASDVNLARPGATLVRPHVLVIEPAG